MKSSFLKKLLPGITLIILLAAVIVVFFFPHEYKLSIILWVIGTLLLVLSILVSIFSFPLSSPQQETSSSFKLGHYGFFLLLIILSIATRRNEVIWDLTAIGQFTLHPRTIEVLEKVNRPIRILGFFSSKSPKGFRFQRWLRRYLEKCPEMSYQMIDPDQNPQLARIHNIQKYDMIVVETDLRSTVVDEGGGEENFLSAILQVTRTEIRHLCFVKGHQEEDYSQFRKGLEAMGYTTSSILLENQEALEACHGLMILGPQTDLRSDEISLLDRIQKNGKNIAIGLSTPPLKNLEDWMSQKGVLVTSDILEDPLNHPVGAPPTTVMIKNYTLSALPKIDINEPSFYPTVRGLTLGGSPLSEGGWINLLIFEQSTHLQSHNSSANIRQQLFLLAAGIYPSSSAGNLLFFGDTDFMNNFNLPYGGNSNIAYGLATWMMPFPDLIQEPLRSTQENRLSWSDQTINRMKWVLVYIIPLAAFAVCFLSWLFKKR